MVVKSIVLLRCGSKILIDYMWLYCYHLLFVITIGYSNTFHVCEYHGYCELLQRMVGVKRNCYKKISKGRPLILPSTTMVGVKRNCYKKISKGRSLILPSTTLQLANLQRNLKRPHLKCYAISLISAIMGINKYSCLKYNWLYITM